ncbi:hypothetical protein BC831DRAFT_516341 [Entophlyctis helioformis]|nr:hypothetical protein BC831DRAFT_516341 [Entophlyctis helioformis]
MSAAASVAGAASVAAASVAGATPPSRRAAGKAAVRAAQAAKQQAQQQAQQPRPFVVPPRTLDIAVNLADGMFRGVYRDKQVHADDLLLVLDRARRLNVQQMIITGVDAAGSREALDLAQRHSLYSTAGCHPTHCSEIESHPQGPDAYFDSLLALIAADRASGNPRIVAIGECGLDYDRTHFCPVETQARYFARHFEVARQTGLPMFLHNRNTGPDFVDTVRRHRAHFSTGVVHSFTGGIDEMRTLTDELGLFIGVNGCSLKTDENIEMVRAVPVDRLMLETDAPWCDIRPTHASFKYLSLGGLSDPIVAAGIESRKADKFADGCMVKSRNEPCTMPHVLRVVAGIKGMDETELAAAVWSNTMRVFFPSKTDL